MSNKDIGIAVVGEELVCERKTRIGIQGTCSKISGSEKFFIV